MKARQTHIVWNAEERELLKLWLIEFYEKEGRDPHKITVTLRDIHQAQLAVLAEDRFRPQLSERDREGLQAAIDDHYRALTEAQILELHKKFIAEHHGKDVFAVYGSLYEEHALTVNELSGAKQQILDLQHSVERLKNQLSRALTGAAAPSTPVAETAVATTKKPPAILIGMNRVPDSIRREIERTGADVRWLKRTDGTSDAQRLAAGRHVLVFPGHVGAGMSNALRKSGASFKELTGSQQSLTLAVAQLCA